MPALPPPDIPDAELEWQAIRAQGPGGQHVNKVASAVQLRFDIGASSLPEAVRTRLLHLRDTRIQADGIIVIKAQRFRTQALNRADALARLYALVAAASVVPKARRPTRPTRAARERRLDAKSQRGQIKALRGKPED